MAVSRARGMDVRGVGGRDFNAGHGVCGSYNVRIYF